MTMEPIESLERVTEGLLRAASCCRELAKLNDANEWRDLSWQLMKMSDKAMQIYKGPPLTEAQIQGLISRMETAQMIARQMSSVH